MISPEIPQAGNKLLNIKIRNSSDGKINLTIDFINNTELYHLGLFFLIPQTMLRTCHVELLETNACLVSENSWGCSIPISMVGLLDVSSIIHFSGFGSLLFQSIQYHFFPTYLVHID